MPWPKSSASTPGPPLTDGAPPRRGRRAQQRAARQAAAAPPPGGIRLNKLLAMRGIGARRKCDALIEGGSVRVNGTVVREPGTRVEPERDQIQVHGRPIPGPSVLRYVMLHKPVGLITTLDDPEGRPTIRRMLPPGPRLFPVGRLDAETSGLLIATNDGELAHHLMHPRYGVAKVYRVRVDRPPDEDQVRRLRAGVEFEPGVVSAPCEVRAHGERMDRAEIELTLHEGRYRQVRRMCEAVGLTVRALHRAAYGPLRLGTLPRGATRDLTSEEVRRLRAASARPTAPAARRPPMRTRSMAGGTSPSVRSEGPAVRPRSMAGGTSPRVRSAPKGAGESPRARSMRPGERRSDRPGSPMTPRRPGSASKPQRRAGSASRPPRRAGGRRPATGASPAGTGGRDPRARRPAARPARGGSPRGRPEPFERFRRGRPKY